MTKIEYINRVKQHLQILSNEERDDAIQYLEEYFEEAGEDNEQQVMDELGAPAKYAAQIKAEAAIKTNENRTRNFTQKQDSSLKTGLMIAGGICALPIALPLLIAVVALIFAGAVTVFALGVAAIAVAIACTIAGIPLLFSSFGMFNLSFADGMVALGASIGMIGLSILIVMTFVLFISRFVPWFIKQMSRLFEKLKGGKNDEEK